MSLPFFVVNQCACPDITVYLSVYLLCFSSDEDTPVTVMWKSSCVTRFVKKMLSIVSITFSITTIYIVYIKIN